ncbi:hypothetical protein DPSP01_005575 [Paraphaeosphaeria sporulosa]
MHPLHNQGWVHADDAHHADVQQDEFYDADGAHDYDEHQDGEYDTNGADDENIILHEADDDILYDQAG